MGIRRMFWLLVLLGMACGGCGGAQGGAGGDFGSEEGDGDGDEARGMRLTDAAFTSAYDNDEKRATAPTSSEFLPDISEVIFFGVVEGIPRGAQVEIRWYKTTSEQALHTSQVSGSGTVNVVSRFTPPSGEPFDEGQYWARVFVNDEQIGDAGFQIKGRRSGGMTRVKELAVSLSVEEGTNIAVQPSNSLPMGVKQVFASFYVGGLEKGNTIRVHWFLEDDRVDEQDLECEGEKRYSVSYGHKKGLAKGNYRVEVEVLGEMFAQRTFYVGDTNSGPVIEKAALGTAAGKKGMPKNAMTSFKKKTKTIRCGIQFLTVPKGSDVEVQWMDGSDNVLETSTSKIKGGGGPSTVGLVWRPGGALKPGPHKAIIMVNGTRLQELQFTVE